MTKIEWISISGPEGRNAIDNFINGQPNLDIKDTIELGTDVGIIYNEGRGRTKTKTKKEGKTNTKSKRKTSRR